MANWGWICSFGKTVVFLLPNWSYPAHCCVFPTPRCFNLLYEKVEGTWFSGLSTTIYASLIGKNLDFHSGIDIILLFLFYSRARAKRELEKILIGENASHFFPNQILIYSSTSFALSNENASDQLFDRFYKIYGVKLN